MEKISKVCLDRVEGDEAVVIVGDEQREIPVAWLPQGAKEGDILVICIDVDDVATQSRRKSIEERHAALTKKSPYSGNIDL